ncbi:TPA: head-tail adaptor protein, partial [Escherichia coli]|nr:head-tail adaptor protein [Escherichia coli]HEM0087407.1 head-tail adaptor protein [Escherichia coli]HEM0087410.1 head-tail adaptor protein [Escherichia coli]
ISDRDRVLFRGKLYSIEGILPDPDSGLEYLTLACSEGVKDG